MRGRELQDGALGAAPNLTAVAAACALAAAASLWPLRSAIAQQAPRDQEDPVIASTGHVPLVVWSEDRGGGGRIYARRLREDGRPVGGANRAEWEVAPAVSPDGRKGDQRWPALAGVHLAWSERLPGAADYDLFLQRLDNYGRPYRGAVQVAGGPGDQLQADIDGTCGDLLVVWSDDRRDRRDIYGRWLNVVNLEPRGQEFVIVRSPGHADEPAVDSKTLSGRRMMRLYFTDDRAGNKDIFVTTFSDNYLTPPRDPTANHEPVITSPNDDYASDVLGPLSSRGALAWTTDSPCTGPDLWVQRFSVNGIPRGEPYVLFGGNGEQSAPTLVDWAPKRNTTGYMVGWQDSRFGTLDVLAMEVASNGRPVSRVQVLAGD